jgi:4-amino-4-deoxy-L-arabinose transferase-like glycosyltransferase
VGAMLALLASPYFLALAGIATLDMGLTLWTTLTLCALLVAEEAAPDEGARTRWLMLAWAAMALAVLSKGLVGIVLPAGALALHALARRDWTVAARLQWGYGLVLFFAIVLPWFVAVAYANPEFARFFFIHEHFTRFLEKGHGRVEPWWYFLPILAAGFLPWMFALPAALAHAWTSDGRSRGFQPLRLACAFGVFVLAFFSLSGSKLPAYLLPAFPPLALVLGRYLADAPPRRLALWLAPMPFVALALGWLAWRAPAGARDAYTRELYAQAVEGGLAGAAVLLLAALGALALLGRGRRWMAVATVAMGSALAVNCMEDAYRALSPRQSSRAIAQQLEPLLQPASRLYSVKVYEQGLAFYLRRTLTLVDYTDEFATGLKAEPGHAIPTLGEFPAHWLQPGDALAIMHPDTYDVLEAQALPMRLLHRDQRRVLVRKP